MCKHIIFVLCKIYKIKIDNDDPNINVLRLLENARNNTTCDETITIKPLVVGDCCICFDPIEDGKKCNTCVGVYHNECINLWLKINKNCPMCRTRYNFKT